MALLIKIWFYKAEISRVSTKLFGNGTRFDPNENNICASDIMHLKKKKNTFPPSKVQEHPIYGCSLHSCTKINSTVSWNSSNLQAK